MNFHLYFKYYLSIVFTAILVLGNAQYIAVDTRPTPEELVKNIFFGAETYSCITVENVAISGHNFGPGDKSWGYFNRNGSTFEMDEGIILSTGKVSKAIGPNFYIQSEGPTSWLGDNDLENAVNIDPDKSINATILEFDFTVTNPNIRKISFEYLFSSEQYLRTIDPLNSSCGFTDGFAFLIREAADLSPDAYRNLALIPGTNIPIKSNTVTGGGEKCPAINEEYFGHYNYDESPTNFNGQTKILNAITSVVAGVTYHLKLVIGDEKNTLYDSGVFLKAGSFIGIKDLGEDLIISAETALCQGSSITLDAAIANPAATYQWYKDDIIIPGAEAQASSYTLSEEGTYQVLINDRRCELKGSVKIEYAEKPIFNANNFFCNDNEGDPITIDLQALNSQIFSNYKSYFKVKYFKSKDDAEDPGNLNTITAPFVYDQDTIIYVRAESSECEAPVQAIYFNTPKRSTILVDKTICRKSETTLEVENTFTNYKWMRENGNVIAEGPSVNSIDQISVGKYRVELESSNGCKLEQEVNVFAFDLPQITNVEVSGNMATVFVSGGKPNYQYSLDSELDQDFDNSNIFQNISRGLHTMYARDHNKCEVSKFQFLILNLINIITPNADGKNDVLDYSDLSIKKNVKIEIYDRYGNQVFISQKAPYLWDGKMNGQVLPTGTYWYILNWIEPATNLPATYKGWILLKNRN